LIQLKAVIFDYGKVLCRPQTTEDMAAMGRVLGLETGEMHRLYWPAREVFDRGDLDPEAYWNSVATQAGRGLTPEEIQELIHLDNESWSRTDPVMLRWANKLRESGIRIGLLSNMPVTLRRHLGETARWLDGFDHLTFSCDVRMIKPEPGIYGDCLKGLGVAAGEALFLDDRLPNVEAARQVGLHSLVFDSPGQARAQMDGCYALPELDL